LKIEMGIRIRWRDGGRQVGKGGGWSWVREVSNDGIREVEV
jgi:hypothetical protein